MVTFTEEILNGKLHFLCSGMSDEATGTGIYNNDKASIGFDGHEDIVSNLNSVLGLLKSKLGERVDFLTDEHINIYRYITITSTNLSDEKNHYRCNLQSRGVRKKR